MSESNIDNNFFSYKTVLENMRAWRKTGTNHASLEFNKYDQGSIWFFRIFFYFYNGDSENSENLSGGLLAPSWELNSTDWYNIPSAYSFLKMNGENERALKLQSFIKLLSNISINSPWYFQEISGLSEAINRSWEKDIKIEETRKQITIKCLPESIDERIGTLIDLYKECAFSWILKKEIIPANLRKFDMGIYIFQTPIYNLHLGHSETEYSRINLSSIQSSSSNYISSYKYFELHNCEFDPSSGTNFYSNVNNKSGFGSDPLQEIKIFFDDIYEYRYNEFFAQALGDLISIDTSSSTTDETMSLDNNSALSELKQRLEYYSNIEKELEDVSNISSLYNTATISKTSNTTFSSFLSKVGCNIVGTVKSKISNILKSIYLGNIYKISIASAINDAKSLYNTGNIATISSLIDDVTKASTNSTEKAEGNIYESSTKNLTRKAKGNIFYQSNLKEPILDNETLLNSIL